MTQSSTRVAVVAGGSGLIGQCLLEQLAADDRYGRILAPLRSCPSSLRDSSIIITALTDGRFDTRAWAGVTDAFCCLGTTRATAGSAKALELIDRNLVVDFARVARAQGAGRLVVVSAVGAALDARSHYSRVKALMEQDLSKLGYASVHVLRPSLLLGARHEHRPLEAVAQRVMPLLNPLLRGNLSRFRSIAAEDVAAAMIEVAQREEAGFFVHHLPLSDL